ncbi:uncharacterized protein EMH_0083210 [Eimeria mitis]|uniref:Uncharacterized protein n=1 Tax=Eimeria mitis TaxID=44415 RepID=U6K9M2_9EIME|nr:uncharacterized protein EMH_0083210 [Eimeria mitis]CDJ33506.1 hypothetical protein EMH_0083210 [Eimeria mitis]
MPTLCCKMRLLLPLFAFPVAVLAEASDIVEVPVSPFPSASRPYNPTEVRAPMEQIGEDSRGDLQTQTHAKYALLNITWAPMSGTALDRLEAHRQVCFAQHNLGTDVRHSAGQAGGAQAIVFLGPSG